MARRTRRQIPTAEWVTGLIGAAIFLGTVGFLAFEALQQGDREAVLSVRVVRVRETNRSFIVDVEVRNEARGAAADVHLVGDVRTADGQQTQAYARLDYVPGFSTRGASLVFESDPGKAPSVRVIGYSRP